MLCVFVLCHVCCVVSVGSLLSAIDGVHKLCNALAHIHITQCRFIMIMCSLSLSLTHSLTHSLSLLVRECGACMYIVHILRMQEYNLQLCAIFISGFLGVLTIKCPVCV